MRHQQVVESIAVIAAVADQAPREVGEEARVEGGGDEVWLIHPVDAARLSGQLFSEVRVAERPCAKYQQ